MSKKAIWSVLVANDSYPSLATFYDHVRRAGLEKVLAGYLIDRHVETVGRILRLHDSNLDSLVRELEAAAAQLTKQQHHVRRELFA
jgi:hypothetical protein